jgi:hypothetical protein
VLTSPLIFFSTGLSTPLIKNFMNFYLLDIVNTISPISCLPNWDAKKIEAIGADPSDISSS